MRVSIMRTHIHQTYGHAYATAIGITSRRTHLPVVQRAVRVSGHAIAHLIESKTMVDEGTGHLYSR